MAGCCWVGLGQTGEENVTFWYQNKMLVREVLSCSWKLMGKTHLNTKEKMQSFPFSQRFLMSNKFQHSDVRLFS